MAEADARVISYWRNPLEVFLAVGLENNRDHETYGLIECRLHTQRKSGRRNCLACRGTRLPSLHDVIGVCAFATGVGGQDRNKRNGNRTNLVDNCIGN